MFPSATTGGAGQVGAGTVSCKRSSPPPGPPGPATRRPRSASAAARHLSGRTADRTRARPRDPGRCVVRAAAVITGHGQVSSPGHQHGQWDDLRWVRPVGRLGRQHPVSPMVLGTARKRPWSDAEQCADLGDRDRVGNLHGHPLLRAGALHPGGDRRRAQADHATPPPPVPPRGRPNARREAAQPVVMTAVVVLVTVITAPESERVRSLTAGTHPGRSLPLVLGAWCGSERQTSDDPQDCAPLAARYVVQNDVQTPQECPLKGIRSTRRPSRGEPAIP